MWKLVTMIITVFLFASNSFGQSTELVMIKSFPDFESENEGDYLTRPFDIKYGNKLFFVADGMAGNIKVFSEDGNFIRKIGRKGQGPGEMSGVFDIALDEIDGTVYAKDAGNGRIMQFSHEGKFVKVIKAERTFEAVEYQNNMFYVKSFDIKAKTNFMLYDSEGNLVIKFGELFDPKANQTKYAKHLYGAILHSYENKIYVFYDRIPIVQIFNKDGQLLKRLTVKVEKFEEKYQANLEGARKGPDERRMINIAPFASGIVTDGNYIYYNVRTKPDEIKIFVVNMDGELERIIPFQEDFSLPIIHRLTAFVKGRFVFADGANAQVKIYKEINK